MAEAGRIKISPQELNDAATYLRQRLENMNQEVSLIKGKIDYVKSECEGAASMAFVNQFENDMYPILNKTLPEVIEGISGELDMIAKTMRETDEALANAIGGK